jgi:tRNA(Ile)-lysidine synthase
MKRYQKQLHIDPVVIHVNHHLRGKEADRDEQFVKDLSKDILGFECITYDVHLTGKELKGNSLEARAREKRYNVFEHCMQSFKLRSIALAHTMNDNAETVLINMLRGTGITGISGIPPVREGFVRPMLGLSRENVLRYLKLQNVPSVTDSTNELPDYLRNRIRHEIIPNLMQLNPGFLNHTLALSDDLREIDTFLNRIAQQAYADAVHEDKKNMLLLRLEKLLAYDSLVVKMVLQIAVKHILGTYYNPRREHIDSIMDMLGKTKDNSALLDMFPESLTIYKDKKYLILDKRDKS